jgi:hypothetical protein
MNTAVPAQSCQPWPASGPVTFQPGTCYSFDPHAASWHLTTFAGLGWVIAAWLVAGLILSALMNWFTDQYEVAAGRRIGFRLWRRWYGTRAWVILRAEADEDEPERYRVLGWDQEDCDAPWVRVMSIDNEDAGSFWAPVTDFAPEAVRRLRPWILRYRWLRLPVLFAYVPLPQPAGYAEADALPLAGSSANPDSAEGW